MKKAKTRKISGGGVTGSSQPKEESRDGLDFDLSKVEDYSVVDLESSSEEGHNRPDLELSVGTDAQTSEPVSDTAEVLSPEEKIRRIIDTLKNFCEAEGISQGTLAEKAGISSSSLHYLFKGKTTPYLLTILKLCEALSISLVELFVLAGIDQGIANKVAADLDMGSEEEPDKDFEAKMVLTYRNSTPEQKAWIKLAVEMVMQSHS